MPRFAQTAKPAVPAGGLRYPLSVQATIDSYATFTGNPDMHSPAVAIVKFLLVGAVLFWFGLAMGADKSKGSAISGNQIFSIGEKDLPGLEKSALTGNADAAFRVYRYHMFYKNDNKTGLYWVEIAAQNGNAVAQQNYAYFLLQTAEPRNKQRARFWIDQAVKGGNKEAAELRKELGAEQ